MDRAPTTTPRRQKWKRQVLFVLALRAFFPAHPTFAGDQDCGCTPTDGGSAIYFDCVHVPARCQAGGGTGGGGGGRTPSQSSQDAFQREVLQQQAARDTENRGAAEDWAQERAAQELAIKEARRKKPGVSPDSTLQLKTKNGGGLQLRGFEPSKKPAAIPGLRHCSDCLGVFQGESKGCDAIISFQKRVDCINRALAVWNRCLGGVDCPAEQRPQIPAVALSKRPRVPANPFFAGEWFLEDDDDPSHTEIAPFATISRSEDGWRISFHGESGEESYALDSRDRQVRFLRYKGKSSTEELIFDLRGDNRTIQLHQFFHCFGPPDCEKGGGSVSVTSILTKKE